MAKNNKRLTKNLARNKGRQTRLDRVGIIGVVKALLGKGRKDKSGDFTKGAGLNRKSNLKRL